MLKIRNACIYIAISVLVWIEKNWIQLPNTNIGRVSFYGPKKMGEVFDLAIKSELAKYDPLMAEELLEGKDQLTFMRVGNLDYYLPAQGTFFVPQWVADHGLDGVSQYIAFCVIGSKQTGIGFHAALRNSAQDLVLSICKQAMLDWIKQKHFPERWLEIYAR
jgi:hypothetical protein